MIRFTCMCKKNSVKILILPLIFGCCVLTNLTAQTCTADYFTVNFKTPTVQSIAQVAFTSDDNISIAGSVLRRSSVLVDAWLTKITKQGTVLWGRAYSSANFDYVQFLNMVPLDDGGSIVSGFLAIVDTTVGPPAILSSTGFLAKLDKFGAVVWTKLFDNIFSPDRMIKSSNGNIITTLTGRKDVANTVVLCFDADGNIKWSNTLKWRPGDSPGSAALKEVSNGSVVIAQRVNVFDFTNPEAKPANGYYALSININSGLKQWDKFYWYKVDQFNNRATFADIVHVTEFKNGNLSFITSYADTAYYLFRITTDVLNITTDKSGNLLSATGYRSDKSPVYASDAAYISSTDQLAVLMDNADAPQMLCIDAEGKLLWQHAYAKVGRSQETTSILGAEEGFYFFCFTHNGGSTEFSLTKTDKEGNADCVQTPLTIYTKDLTGFYKQENGALALNATPSSWYAISTIGSYDYKIQPAIICKQTCCTDVTNTLPVIDLCNQEFYTLPNNDIIKASGKYALAYKTTKGCDSLVYYDITFSKSPDVELGTTNCLDGKDSIILKTNTAYNNYTWNGVLTQSPYFVVKMPGTYRVSVTNACGTKADSVAIFQLCEFAITMPNAFTPNKDGKNDIFRIPPQVNNHLIKFIVYNRWGQPVFTTSNISEGWEGTYKQQPAPPDTYVYFIEMQSLDGKRKLTKKGWVTLLR